MEWKRSRRREPRAENLGGAGGRGEAFWFWRIFPLSIKGRVEEDFYSRNF